MNTKHLLSMIFLVLFTLISCEKDVKDPSLDDFCSVIPADWKCEIIKENFNVADIPRNAPNPFAVIKYVNYNRAFSSFGQTTAHPSLILDMYPISQKNDLVKLIKSQQLYSWCVPIYYGETKRYFIITSPCYMNGGNFSEQADSSWNDLRMAIRRIIEVENYGFIGE